MPKDNTAFAALPSIFGGEYDHLVLRAASGQSLYISASAWSLLTSFITVGDIYVWDRDSAVLIYCIRAPAALQSQLTSFAWNGGSSDYMFATGTHDGTVHIWTIPPPEVLDQDNFDSGSPSTYTDVLSDTPFSNHANPFFRSRFSTSRQTTRASDETTSVAPDFVAGS